MIFTDGNINDIDMTVDEIVKLSEYPVSIIIVGIGQQNFSKMEM